MLHKIIHNYQKLGSPKPRTDFPGVLYSVPMYCTYNTYKFRCLVVLFTAIKNKNEEILVPTSKKYHDETSQIGVGRIWRKSFFIFILFYFFEGGGVAKRITNG